MVWLKSPYILVFQASALISPSLHLFLPHFQISISHFSLDSPGCLYLPCHFLFSSVPLGMRKAMFDIIAVFICLKKDPNIQVQSVQAKLDASTVFESFFLPSVFTLQFPGRKK